MFKKVVTRSVFGKLQLTQISLNFKTSFCREQNCLRLFYYFNFERNYDIFKSKSPCILLNKNTKFKKNKTESKMENPVLRRRTFWFSSYKNCKFKVKLWSVGAHERKKRAFFVPLILSEGNCFNISVLSRCIVYWINFQNIHTFPYRKTSLHTLLLLAFKIVESLQLQCIFKHIFKTNLQRDKISCAKDFISVHMQTLALKCSPET